VSDKSKYKKLKHKPKKEIVICGHPMDSQETEFLELGYPYFGCTRLTEHAGKHGSWGTILVR
jgi:hypothetical protein